MLILERRINKGVIVGIGSDETLVTVLGVSTDPITGQHIVKLGFDAPKHVCIDREEVRPKRNKRIKMALNGTDPQS